MAAPLLSERPSADGAHRPAAPTPPGATSRPAIVMPAMSAESARNGAYKPPAPNGAVGVRLGGVASDVAVMPRAAVVEIDDDETLLNDDDEESHPLPSGILGRARAGAPLANRSTPYGSAGRVRLPPSPATLRMGAAQPSLGQSTRGGTPLGAPPKAGVSVGQAKPRSAPPNGISADREPPVRPATVAARGSMFATPLPPARPTASVQFVHPTASVQFVYPTASVREMDGPPTFGGATVAHDLLIEKSTNPDPITADLVLLEDDDELDSYQDEAPTTLAAIDAPLGSGMAGRSRDVPTVELDSGEDAWLADALVKADALTRSFPPQATLELSREPNLPFTLVISRATPAMAVRAMVNFVEFLASIATPPRARIELLGVAHLDRSFHKNVEAALEPYFGGNLEVRPGPGQVDIRFTDPDPQWSAYPRLPR